MPRYTLDLDQPTPEEERKGRKLGCSIIGWATFLLVFAFIVFMGYRVWYFYSKIRKGEIVDLPQFTERLTTAGDGQPRISPSVVDRSSVETTEDPSLGAGDDPRLVIVAFADFECPFSKEEAPIVRTLMARYGAQVKFIYRDFPLVSIHQNAFQASLAAECADEQGKFWAYHDKLYINAPALSFQDLLSYAEETGHDMVQFEKCLVDARYRDEVQRDVAAGERLGIRGTPTFFFNGQRIEGAIPPDVFERLIDSFLK